MKRLVLGVPLALALAACSTSGTSATSAPTNVPSAVGGTPASEAATLSPAASPTPRSTASATASPTVSATSAPPSASPTGVQPCGDGELTVTGMGLAGATSHSEAALVFTNRSGSTCTVTGYPGVAGEDASGRQVVQATRTTSSFFGGTYGAAAVITLAPGAAASTILEGDNGATAGPSCPGVVKLLVTPPGSHVSTTVTENSYDCPLFTVHPVVAGKSGK